MKILMNKLASSYILGRVRLVLIDRNPNPVLAMNNVLYIVHIEKDDEVSRCDKCSLVNDNRGFKVCKGSIEDFLSYFLCSKVRHVLDLEKSVTFTLLDISRLSLFECKLYSKALRV